MTKSIYPRTRWSPSCSVIYTQHTRHTNAKKIHALGFFTNSLNTPVASATTDANKNNRTIAQLFQMANVDTRIAKFISDNNLDESIMDKLTELVNECFGDLAVAVAKQVKATATTGNSSIKALKADKLDDPTDAESFEDLRRCTSVTLNTFCKEKGLKVGAGTKKDIMERVWRFLQGNSLEDDNSPRSKPKKLVTKSEKHQCCGSNSKGVACGTSATEECDGKWFCWRHITEVHNGTIYAVGDSENEAEPAPQVVKPRRKAVKI